MERCNLILERLREGIDVLAADDRALTAFRFANRAMALQRIHSIYALARRRGDKVTLDALNVRKNRSWRPFQLAFMLLSVPALADRLTGTVPTLWRLSPDPALVPHWRRQDRGLSRCRGLHHGSPPPPG